MPGQYAAHEMLAMNEALMTKSAHIQMLNMFAQLAVDTRLKSIAQKQAQTGINHYNLGVQLIQGQEQVPTMAVQYHMDTFGEPKLGLSQMAQVGQQPGNVTAPATNASPVTDKAIATTILNLQKFGCISWMTLGLECANPKFREYLVDGANLCHKLAYEVWSYMNHQGYYQVPEMPMNAVQQFMQNYQLSPGAKQMELQ
ncbi:spore coat protein [Alicyclobacillus suci]|uniref:spore coat protein n=1 Tax=Alicyclobacillus suci TaxID=2816080 RepID=UPI001A8C5DE4|nr:spore coat protein [Alicyclobacillus suci]